MPAITPILVSTSLTVPPAIAFEIFVGEIDRWWRPGPYFWNDPARAVGMHFERGVGGRWLERWDTLGDENFVMGEITGWEPGTSLALTYHSLSLGNAGYPVTIQFEPTAEGTTITLSHDGWDAYGDDAIPARDRYARGWESVLSWYQNWANWGSPLRLGPPEPRHGYVLQPGEGVDGNTALKASRRSTHGTLSITDSVTIGGAPLHVHREDDEVFYVLDGTLLVTIDGQTHRLPPGGVAYIPAGLPHAWDTEGEARLLIITAPGGLEEFLDHLHSWPHGYADAWRVLGERHGYTLV